MTRIKKHSDPIYFLSVFCYNQNIKHHDTHH